MVNIIIFKDKCGNVKQIESIGHAYHAEKGKDIVCAAISVTFYNAIGALIELVGLKKFYIEKSGKLKMTIPPNLSQNELDTIKIIMDTTIIGLRQIAIQYRSKIKLIEETL